MHYLAMKLNMMLHILEVRGLNDEFNMHKSEGKKGVKLLTRLKKDIYLQNKTQLKTFYYLKHFKSQGLT